MIYPLLPLFLTRTLGAPMKAVGLIEGFAEATSSVLRIVAGWLSDRVGRRKPFVVAGYACAAVAKPLLAFAGTWGHVRRVPPSPCSPSFAREGHRKSDCL
jgi:MFS family permease